MANPTVTVDVSSVEATRGTRVILDQFGRIIKRVKVLDQVTEQAAKKVSQSMQRIGTTAKRTGNNINGMSNKLRNLGSSAIFAIGPLSGVGARIVAFTAIANRGSIAIAAMLAVTAALTVAVFKLASRMIEVRIATDRVINSLKVATGSAGKARQEFRFVEREVARLGIGLEVSVRQFAQLSAAAKGTTLQGEGVRKIFTAVAQAAAVLQLSTDATQGAFRAIQQIMSKGTVQAEELRGQLGERLPGAFQIAARAMGKTTAELGKMLEAGELLSEDFLPKFAEELSRAFGPGVEDAIATLTAETNKLETALFGVFQELDRITGLSDIWESFVRQIRLLAEDTKKILSSPTIEDQIRDRFDEVSARLRVLRLELKLFGDQATRFLRPFEQETQQPIQPVASGQRRGIVGVEVRALQPPGFGKTLIEAARLEAELNKLKEQAIKLGFQLESGITRRKSLIISLSKAETIQLGKDRTERIRLDKFETKLLATLERKPATIRQITEAQKQGNRAARISILTIGAENRLIRRGITLTEDRTTSIRKLTIAIEAEEEALRRTRTGLAKLARGEQTFDILSDSAVRGLKGMEDALVDFVTQAESAGDAFKGFARIVIEELQRMLIAATITKPLAGILQNVIGSITGGLLGIGNTPTGGATPTGPTGTQGIRFQHGGRLGSGQLALVGEAGPELFVPDRSGTIVPNNAITGGTTIIQNFDFRGASLEAVALLQQKAEEIKAETLAAVQASGLRGGSISRLPKV